eukprot:m.10298 g.10298  ORF g.10298 m.10298 type:complete len:255 (+) comp3745_c0_seq1:104-868(+)
MSPLSYCLGVLVCSVALACSEARAVTTTGDGIITATSIADPVPSSLVAFNSSTGRSRMLEALNEGTAQPFWQLSAHLESQATQTYCGIASISASLNSLNVKAPIDPIYIPHAYFTQEDVFSSECAKHVVLPDIVKHFGTTLDQAAGLLECWGAKAAVVHANTSSVESFRTAMATSMTQLNAFTIVNFLRGTLDQNGHAHFSPVAAYHKPSDSILLLDVARYKYPPVWVPTDTLFQAMQTTDTTSRKSRGWVTAQ